MRCLLLFLIASSYPWVANVKAAAVPLSPSSNTLSSSLTQTPNATLGATAYPKWPHPYLITSPSSTYPGILLLDFHTAFPPFPALPFSSREVFAFAHLFASTAQIVAHSYPPGSQITAKDPIKERYINAQGRTSVLRISSAAKSRIWTRELVITVLETIAELIGGFEGSERAKMVQQGVAWVEVKEGGGRVGWVQWGII